MLKQKLIVEHALAKSGKDFQDTLTVPFEKYKTVEKRLLYLHVFFELYFL